MLRTAIRGVHAKLAPFVFFALLIAVLMVPTYATALDQRNPLRPNDPYCWALDPYHMYVGSTYIPSFTTGDDSRQCVEYAKRFFYYGMNYKADDGIVTNATNWTGNGTDYYWSAAAKGLDAYENGGSTRPAPGDILCLGGGYLYYGHVAIVTAVSDTAVTVLAQNSASLAVLPMSTTPGSTVPTGSPGGATYSVAVGDGFWCQGWLRRRLHPAKLAVIGRVNYPSGPYVVEQTLRGSFTVKNTGDVPGTWAPLVMALRGPDGQNRDAVASGYIYLAPGKSTTVRFSRTLDLVGDWSGFVSARPLGTADWQSDEAATVAFSVRERTGTIRVNLKRDDWSYWLYSPHINTATIHVYGPGTYYRSTVVRSRRSVIAAAPTFGGAPVGAYRVRVEWAEGNDSSAQEANQYFSTSRSSPNHTCDFNSP